SALRGGARHGYQIALDLEERSRGLVSFQHGTLYPILHRLEGEDLIEGDWEKDGGRRRKVYTLTASGRRHLAEQSERCRTIFRGLDRLLIGEADDESVRDGPEAGRRPA
ncbi:MAG: PadR family transcriptional regulator, partial [Gemmatimonadota bacterium]